MKKSRVATDGKEANNAESLRQTAQLLQTVLESVPTRVFWKDEDLVYRGCSHLFATDAGLESPAEIVGKTDTDLPWPKESVETWQAEERRVIETGRPQLASEHRLQAADGRELLVIASRVPLQDSEGRTVGVLGAYEDVTQRMLVEDQLRRSEERFRILFNETADSLFLGDSSGRFVDANRKACETLGYSREELLNLTAQDVVLDYPREAMEEHWRLLRDGCDITLRCAHRRKDGSTFPAEAHLSLFEYRDQTHTLAVVRDITERLRDEEEKRTLELRMEEQKRRFYRETIFSVTGGKLDICEQQDVDVWLVNSDLVTEVRIPADASSARHQVEDYCRNQGMDEDIIKSVILGVGEAVTNALKHAGAGEIHAGTRQDKTRYGLGLQTEDLGLIR